MKRKPILFSSPMVKAILEGRKTMTRRIIKDSYIDLLVGDKKPYCKKGDVLWVRETFAYMDEFVLTYKVDPYYHIGYKADLSCKNIVSGEHLNTEGWNWENEVIKWKPSIHMPKDACRIFLKVKGVRIERVQEITEADAIAEGIQTDLNISLISAYDKFRRLWREINGIDSWNKNLFVWVITFERI